MSKNNKQKISLQVLIATMNQKKIKDLLKKMNIQTDAIITNQTDEFSKEEIKYNNKFIKLYNFDERGIGLNRNNGLMRATSDILLFADDDIKYVNGYETIVIEEFKKNEKADMIIFNIDQSETERKRYKIKKYHRVHKYNCLRYGAVRIAVKTEKIKKKNIYFSLLFGGGAKYGSGEDSIFIYNCIKKGLKVYACPKTILTLEDSESTWFDGYNEKFFYDKGALLSCLYGKLTPLYVYAYIIKHKDICKKIGIKNAIREMLDGHKNIRM